MDSTSKIFPDAGFYQQTFSGFLTQGDSHGLTFRLDRNALYICASVSIESELDEYLKD